MKAVFFLILLTFSFNLQAEEVQTTIYVSCPCTITIDGLMMNEGMVTGTDTNPSESTLETCLIENGKVIQGCWLAKQRALGSCMDHSRRMNPNEFRPSAYIEESLCYGAIEEESVEN